ncbi:MAG: SpoIIE family protein phosphatase [Bdellovibrionales bacterium]
MKYEDYAEEELREALEAKDQEILFLKEQILKAAHKAEFLSEKMERQLGVSKKLLDVLSPTELPRITGYKFSSKYIASSGRGGDYMEIMNFKEQYGFGILLANFKGAGLSALFLACLLKFGTQISSIRNEPDKVFRMLADELSPGLKAEEKTDLVYATVDKRKSKMEYCSSGSSEIFYYRDNSLHSVSANSSPITDGDVEIKKSSLSLEKDDVVLLLSPGILGLDGFNSSKIEEILNEFLDEDLNVVRNEIIFYQKSLLNGQKPEADSSIILFQHQDRSLKLA